MQKSSKKEKYEVEREHRISRRRSLTTELSTAFCEYYREALHELFSTDSNEHWEQFLTILRVPLHLVFRLSQATNLRPEVQQFLRDLAVIDPCRILPECMAYECSNDRFDIPNIKQVIQDLNASGFITFQESVSMLPSIALVRELQKSPRDRDWYLLDACAAPASKSLHLLDLMRSSDQIRGVLLSCEMDRVKATQTLPARLKRAQSPCSFGIHGDATRLPRLYSGATSSFIEFDGALCDVPCSGDGTCRKDNMIQQLWDESFALKLHEKQCTILRRGMELLREDGICVYSLCSMNPIENECVLVRGAIEASASALVQISNIQSLVPEFRFSNAVTFPEAAREATAVHRLEQAIRSKSPENADFHFARAAEAMQMAPAHVGRVLPHVNNTGGFFTAMLQKSPAACPSAGHSFSPKSYSHWGGYKRFRALNAAEKAIIERFYGIDVEQVTAHTGMHFVVHGTHDDKPRRVLLLSEGCHAVLHALLYKAKKETITYAGVRIFSFWSSKLFMPGEDSDILFRTTYEGAQHIAPLSDGRRVIPMCFLQYAKLVHRLLCNGTVISASLASHLSKAGGQTTAKLGACLQLLHDEASGPHASDSTCTRCFGQHDDARDRDISPGPVWIALDLSCLRKLGRDSVSTATPPILWLSGVLYFSRLELTTKEPIRKGMRLVLFQSFSRL